MKRPLLIAISLMFTSFTTYAADSSTSTYQRDAFPKVLSPEIQSAGEVVAPDNTKINERDRYNQTLTSGKQSNAKGDLKLSSQIRRTIVKSDLSTLAKNIKIITINGEVTLRGPVQTEAEKEKIGNLASNVQGIKKLDNQLEVKNISNLTTKE